jgi:hemerythrin superfamily protein
MARRTMDQDLVRMLKRDHHEVEQLFEELAESTGTGDRRALADQLIIKWVRHSAVEGQCLYPTVREHVPGGGEVAQKEIAEQARAERMMKQLEVLNADDPGFDDVVARLRHEIEEHIHGEENELFPQLVEACDHEMLVELGRKAKGIKRTAPTRPHPGAPSKVIGRGLGLVDRVRDLLSGRGR